MRGERGERGGGEEIDEMRDEEEGGDSRLL